MWLVVSARTFVVVCCVSTVACVDLVIESFDGAASSLLAVGATPWAGDGHGQNASLVIVDMTDPTEGGYLSMSYTVEQEQAWGGQVSMARSIPADLVQASGRLQSIDCTGGSHLSFRARVSTPQSNPGRVQLRILLYDSSECATQCLVAANVEVYYAFFDILSSASGWTTHTAELVGGASLSGWGNFAQTGWSGGMGNGALDAAHISQWVLQLSINGLSGSEGSLRCLNGFWLRRMAAFAFCSLLMVSDHD